MDIVLVPLMQVLLLVIQLYVWALIISAILSWLVAFNIVNPYNQFVATVGGALERITEPALRPIRRLLPAMGGIDLSPLVLIIGLFFVRGVIEQMLFRMT